MPVIITVDKGGKLKEVSIKEYNETELYKKTSFKNGEGFERQTIWNTKINGIESEISLYAKVDGRAGQENKYEFPPPIAEKLYFGTCILVNQNGLKDLKIQEWKEVYDKLMGGFDDLDDDEDVSDEEEDEYSNLQIGCDGYARDGFIADDEEEEEEEEDDDEDEEEEVIKKKPTQKKKTKTSEIKPKHKKVSVFIKAEEILEKETDNYLDCQSELDEEEYLS